MSTRDPQDKKKKLERDAFSDFADKLIQSENEDKEERKKVLKEGIEDREKVKDSTLKSSRLVTEKLSKIREDAGLSAFVGTSGKIKSPRFRRGDFLKLLARELLLIGSEELKDTGGIVSLNKLEEHFAENRQNWDLRKDDISEAIAILVKEKLVPGFQKIDDQIKLVHFIPIELSDDPQIILKASIGIDASVDKLSSILGWSEERVNSGIEILSKKGMAVVDGQSVYFPGL